MKIIQDRYTGLPIHYDLTLIYVFSFIIAILVAAASITGLIDGTIIYPTKELFRAFVPNDVVNIFIGLPILFGSMWLTRRGKLIGLLCWPGALLFVLYNYIIYVFAMPFNWAFLLHLMLVAMTVYALIGLVVNIDGNEVQQRLAGTVPDRVAGGILVGLGFLFFLRALDVVINALTYGTPMSQTELAVNVSDFLITPTWVIGGIGLWRRKKLGYVSGLGLLFQASMLFVALILVLLLQPFMTAAPFAAADIAVIFAMGLICFIPFTLFARSVLSERSSSSI